MLRADDAVGVIAVTRTQVGGFARAEIALLQTFADQAVIAVENARLLTELQAKNADLTEALEQQTATAEILRVISSSPTDIQPVLDAVTRARPGCARPWTRRSSASTARLLSRGPVTGPIAGCYRSASRSRWAAARSLGRAASSTADVHVTTCRPRPRRVSRGQPTMRGRSATGRSLAVPADAGRFAHRRDPAPPHRGPALHRTADRPAADLRRPGRHRHRERPPVHRAGGAQRRAARGARAADGDQRAAQGDRPVAPSTSSRCSTRWPRTRSGCARPSAARSSASTARSCDVVATHNMSAERRAFLERNPIRPGRGAASAGRASGAADHPDSRRPGRSRVYLSHAAQADVGLPDRRSRSPCCRADELLGVIFIYRTRFGPSPTARSP